MRWEGWILCALFAALAFNMVRDTDNDPGSAAVGVLMATFFSILVMRLAT